MAPQQVGRQLQAGLVPGRRIEEIEAAPAQWCKSLAASARFGDRAGRAIAPQIAPHPLIFGFDHQPGWKRRIEDEPLPVREYALQVVGINLPGRLPLDRKEEPGVDLWIQIRQRRDSAIGRRIPDWDLDAIRNCWRATTLFGRLLWYSASRSAVGSSAAADRHGSTLRR